MAAQKALAKRIIREDSILNILIPDNEIDGGTKLKVASVTSDRLVPGSITSNEVGENQITGFHIDSNQIPTLRPIDTEHIRNEAVGTPQLQLESVNKDILGPQAVGPAHLTTTAPVDWEFRRKVIFHDGIDIIGGTTDVSEIVNTRDNIIVLNADVTGSPTDNVGIQANRGTSTDAFIVFDEATDRWSIDNGTGTLSPILSSGTALVVNETDIVDGTILARLGDAENVTGDWDFTGALSIDGRDIQSSAVGVSGATRVGYDNINSGAAALDVQAAIDEAYAEIDLIAGGGSLGVLQQAPFTMLAVGGETQITLPVTPQLGILMFKNRMMQIMEDATFAYPLDADATLTGNTITMDIPATAGDSFVVYIW